MQQSCPTYVMNNRHYSVRKLWQTTTELPIEIMAVDSLIDSLETTSWTIIENGKKTEVCPLDVLRKKVIDKYHQSRIEKADLKFPIIVISKQQILDMAWDTDPPYLVVDGLHRLCKCIRLNYETISVRKINRSIFEDAFLTDLSDVLEPSAEC